MLSILIPTYNYNINPLVEKLHAMAVKETIAFEIIILDDASPNYTLPMSEHGNVIFLKNESNLGRTLTRKKLAEAAQYDTLLFLDADVIPVSENFILNYLLKIKGEFEVILGGYAYDEVSADKRSILRYKYGREREEKNAAIRNLNPYGYIFSGNILIKKQIFLSHNYADTHNLYGMDIFFAYQLFISKIKVTHIDNPIYHLGLEDNQTFFNKCLQSVVSRKLLLENAEGIENINGLLRHYKKLRAYGLTGFAGFMFKISEPLLKRMILKKDPNLFCLDLYRLGYICTI